MSCWLLLIATWPSSSRYFCTSIWRRLESGTYSSYLIRWSSEGTRARPRQQHDMHVLQCCHAQNNAGPCISRTRLLLTVPAWPFPPHRPAQSACSAWAEPLFLLQLRTDLASAHHHLLSWQLNCVCRIGLGSVENVRPHLCLSCSQAQELVQRKHSNTARRQLAIFYADICQSCKVMRV